ncbi:MAG TPA: Hsp20 family protein, partial [Candidatus Limnocylindrales bacterium]|nr:Hsp20 family protein [Candidatus Limnocylindrales bacterium]
MLQRRMPERRMSSYRSPVDWLFDDPWADGGQWSMAMMPSIDMRETDDAYVIEADLPGVKPEDIEVTLDGRTLIIQGRYGTDEEKRDKEGRYLVHERRSGTFTRGITLPGAIDAERIDSRFENGEL